MSGDATRLAGSPASARTELLTPTSGWLSSSGSIDHGRFAPGTVLDARYRIIGLLGRGGMGEVYRADDLRLGQPVALKFLPEALAGDARRLAQLHNEVRTARQVSHANVCRVYDIGDVQGQLFLSMEYVDGEDLAASLRRMGRFPEDKAIEISRQLCAGLAAAHDRGVIHRDLKPANIMIDGSGRVRIMDFGLAAAGAVEDVRVGTPAYMAPEQLEGREVTAKSDIFALGLVLYELFTGRRVFTAATLADLVEMQASGQVTPPTEIVKNLDPSIERAILRCLDRDPARRPASVLAVSAALPGGDPLAAALAAGETPSPEMIAAAGGDSATVSLAAGLVWLTLAAVLLLAAPLVSDRLSLVARSPVTKPPAALADRAEELRASLGYTDPAADQAWGFLFDGEYLYWASRHGSAGTHWAELPEGRPSVVRFWYRTSPRQLIPFNPVTSRGLNDPPFGGVTGMTTIQVDTKGRLMAFEAMPTQADPAEPVAAPAMDWGRVLALAGFDPTSLTPAAPRRTPRTFADTRQAWQGVMPGTSVPVTIEAASYRGRPVAFEIVGPWSSASRDSETDGGDDGNGPGAIITILVLLVVAGFLTRANLRSGRADRRGAFRLAVSVVAITMAAWLFLPHVSSLAVERSRMFVTIGLSLFLAGALYVIYLAIEPFVRKSWPAMLTSWSRLLSGRVRDAFVGRDLLIGVVAGLVIAMLGWAEKLVPIWMGWPEAIPFMPQPSALVDLRQFVAAVLSTVSIGLQSGLITVLQLAILRFGVQRVITRFKIRRVPIDTATIVMALAVVALVARVDANADARTAWLSFVLAELSLVVTVVLVMRVGLLCTVFAYIVSTTVTRIPITFDSSRFYAGQGWVVLALLFAVAAVGLQWARAGAAASAGRKPT